MLVSHETPVSFLETSRRYNDYDYALVHLFETNPEYYSFFKASKTLGREVLLDNSIFELGEAFDTKKFVKYVKELEPTYYVVPDVLEAVRCVISQYLLHCSIWSTNGMCSKSVAVSPTSNWTPVT